MADAVPFPLPDLPRAPESDLGRLACRILEHRDIGALTRLPDMLMDMGRESDARMVKFLCHCGIKGDDQARSVLKYNRPTWGMIAAGVSSLLWWDIFDWEATLAVMAKELVPKQTPFTGVSSRSGSLTVRLDGDPAPDMLAGFVQTTEGWMTPEEAHAREMHPDYEYCRTVLGYACSEQSGWERNEGASTGESWHWRRRRVTAGGLTSGAGSTT